MARRPSDDHDRTDLRPRGSGSLDAGAAVPSSESAVVDGPATICIGFARSWRARCMAFLRPGRPAAAAPPPAPAEGFQTIAPFAILMDAETGAVLFEKNADSLMAPASTAKIMTAEIVFHEIERRAAQARRQVRRVGERLAAAAARSSRGSTMFAAVNSRIRVEDLIRGLVIQSGNDAAIALAEGIAGSEDAFAALMNQRAARTRHDASDLHQSLGQGRSRARRSRRATWRGSPSTSSATYPDFYAISASRSSPGTRSASSTAIRCSTMNIGADGLKTGDIAESGFGLVGSAVQNGQRLIVVVNGLQDRRATGPTKRCKLLNWGFRSFEPKSAVRGRRGGRHGRGSTAARPSEVPLVADGPVKLLVPRGAGERLTGKIVYTGPLLAPVEKGAAGGAAEDVARRRPRCCRRAAARRPTAVAGRHAAAPRARRRAGTRRPASSGRSLQREP